MESVRDWEGLIGEPPVLEEEAAQQLRTPAYLPRRARFLPGQPTAHDGPWICLECRGWLVQHGCPDITLDFGLAEYLWMGTLPA